MLNSSIIFRLCTTLKVSSQVAFFRKNYLPEVLFSLGSQPPVCGGCPAVHAVGMPFTCSSSGWHVGIGTLWYLGDLGRWMFGQIW